MNTVDHLMKTLDISQEEALQLIEDDKKIDRDEPMPFDLSKEQIKETRQYRQTERTPTVYKFTQRERKPNEAKREIIQLLDEALTDFADNVTVTNVERQIDFVLDDVRYRIVLSAPRK